MPRLIDYLCVLVMVLLTVPLATFIVATAYELVVDPSSFSKLSLTCKCPRVEVGK